jgi:prophage regulatory protein
MQHRSRFGSGDAFLSDQQHAIRRTTPAVKAQTGLSRSTIYQLMADGNFPKSIALGPRAVGWLASDIDDWIDARIAASRKETLQ